MIHHESLHKTDKSKESEKDLGRQLGTRTLELVWYWEGNRERKLACSVEEMP